MPLKTYKRLIKSTETNCSDYQKTITSTSQIKNDSIEPLSPIVEAIDGSKLAFYNFSQVAKSFSTSSSK